MKKKQGREQLEKINFGGKSHRRKKPGHKDRREMIYNGKIAEEITAREKIKGGKVDWEKKE